MSTRDRSLHHTLSYQQPERELIDSTWEETDKILEELTEETDETIGEIADRYGFEDKNTLIKFIEKNLTLQNVDISRILKVFEDPKCPYCEIEGENPSMEYINERFLTEAPYRPQIEEAEIEIRNLFCDTHFDSWIEYQEKTYRRK